MPILQDLEIRLTAEQLLAEGGQGRQRPSLLAAAEEAATLSQSLLAPLALYDEFETRSVHDELLELADGQPSLSVGPKADLLAPAETVQIAVYTIGEALETTVGELMRSGEPLLSYMLDCAGVLALGAIGEHMRVLTEERAAERGWGVSPALSPGSLVGWSLTGQRELCSLLPIADIGIRLSEYCVLEPHKSVSVLIGMGAGYDAHEVGSVCRYCSLRDRCWRRRRSEA
jgi:hypothetical protein